MIGYLDKVYWEDMGIVFDPDNVQPEELEAYFKKDNDNTYIISYNEHSQLSVYKVIVME